MHGLDDNEIEWIKKSIKNDASSCEKLYKKHSGWLYSICLRYLNNREDAQDVLQDSFVLIFKNLAQYTFEGNFKGWMRKITVNCALSFYRKQGTQIVAVEDSSKFENSFIDINFLNEIDNQELLYFINLLSPGRKQVFNAYVIEGYSHKEISENLGISEGTSKSQLFDAKRELKKALEQKYSEAKSKNHE